MNEKQHIVSNLPICFADYVYGITAEHRSCHECNRQTECKEQTIRSASIATKTASKKQLGGTHYLEMKVQPWEVIQGWSRDEIRGYYKGTAIAYLMRAGQKGSFLLDIEKAIHTLEALAEQERKNA